MKTSWIMKLVVYANWALHGIKDFRDAVLMPIEIFLD